MFSLILGRLPLFDRTQRDSWILFWKNSSRRTSGLNTISWHSAGMYPLVDSCHMWYNWHHCSLNSNSVVGGRFWHSVMYFLVDTPDSMLGASSNNTFISFIFKINCCRQFFTQVKQKPNIRLHHPPSHPSGTQYRQYFSCYWHDFVKSMCQISDL